MRYYSVALIDEDALGQLGPGAIHPALADNSILVGLFANYGLAKPLIGAAGVAEIRDDPIYDFFFMFIQPAHRTPIIFKYIASMLKTYEKYTKYNQLRKPMMTICDYDVPRAEQFLMKLGFRFIRTEAELAIWGKYG